MIVPDDFKLIPFPPDQNYWIVGGDENRVWCLARGYVPSDDAEYLAWLETPTLPTRIASEQELRDVLIGYGLKGPGVSNDPVDYPLSKRQLRLALFRIAGKPVTFVQDLIDGITDPVAQGTAQIWWDDTDVVEWNNPVTMQLVTASGLTNEQAVALWLQAKDL